MDVKLLFMDEKYSDANAPEGAQMASLCGVLVPANLHREFRDRYYGLVGKALGAPHPVTGKWPDEQIHASNLLPDSTDEERFSFLEGLVELVNEFRFQVYRLSLVRTPQNVSSLEGESGLVETSFQSLLSLLRNSFPETQVWPVMEIDRTDRQDQAFAGLIQRLDYRATHHILPEQASWWDDSHFGEVLYVTKMSSYGSMVDCVTYLLHVKWLDSNGYNLTPFKKRLAEIATGFKTIEIDRVMHLTVEW